MAQGNNAKREGARSYELYQLQALNRIVTAVTTGTGSLATESTLLSVLNAIIASDQDIEILLVRDTGNADKIVQQITNYETGVPVVSYKDVDGNPYTPTGPLEYLDPSAVLNLMLTELLTLNAGGALATEATQLLIDSNIVLGNLTLNAIDTVLDTIKIDSDTLATPVTGLGMTLFTGVNQSGTTSAGQRSISILNAGANAASVAGGVNNLLPGVEVTWEAGGLRDTLGSLTWDGTVNGGTTLIISTVG